MQERFLLLMGTAAAFPFVCSPKALLFFTLTIGMWCSFGRLYSNLHAFSMRNIFPFQQNKGRQKAPFTGFPPPCSINNHYLSRRKAYDYHLCYRILQHDYFTVGFYPPGLFAPSGIFPGCCPHICWKKRMKFCVFCMAELLRYFRDGKLRIQQQLFGGFQFFQVHQDP